MLLFFQYHEFFDVQHFGFSMFNVNKVVTNGLFLSKDKHRFNC
ncbi:hypothetical protein T4B_8258 [Trichinella pseudospiralis]|uniref:Uncharacterized protein n=1 Tax=Trichinella pseudospiralis TaxID=6337 RepID=A0A0V1G834_TRIPS|nr:hypothetical protein T4B_8258 [Trichinella pseudospiralis]